MQASDLISAVKQISGAMSALSPAKIEELQNQLSGLKGQLAQAKAELASVRAERQAEDSAHAEKHQLEMGKARDELKNLHKQIAEERKVFANAMANMKAQAEDSERQYAKQAAEREERAKNQELETQSRISLIMNEWERLKQRLM